MIIQKDNGDAMKRTFKKIFSRFSFVGLTIVLLFLLFVGAIVAAIYVVDRVVLVFYPDAELYVRYGLMALDYIILIFTVLHAANRDMVPETKIPWILAIVAFNVLGVAMYYTFSFLRPTRRQRKRLMSIAKKNGYFVRPDEEQKKRAAEAVGHWISTGEALSAVNRSAVLYGNTKTEYFPTGVQFAKRFLRDLEGAEKYIFMEYFIIGKGKFWSAILDVLERKAKAGLDVRLIYDDIGSMGKVHFRYHKTLRKKGIKCEKFNPFVPVVTNIHNNRDHRKITVIDGKIAYTGGLNLADEYVNAERPFGYWKDNAVRLEGEGVRSFIQMFLYLYDMQTRSNEDFAPFFPEEYPQIEGEGWVQPYGDGPSPIYERHLGEDVYINILAGAHDYVWIMTPYLIIDYRLREALVLAAKRGVDVRIVTPHIPDKKIAFALTRSNYLALIRGGVKIYEYLPGFVHAKSFLADGTVGVVGTINLDYRSLLFHYEDAVLMFKTAALEGLREDFEGVFAVSAQLTEEEAKKNVVWRIVCEFAKLFAPLF